MPSSETLPLALLLTAVRDKRPNEVLTHPSYDPSLVQALLITGLAVFRTGRGRGRASEDEVPTIKDLELSPEGETLLVFLQSGEFTLGKRFAIQEQLMAELAQDLSRVKRFMASIPLGSLGDVRSTDPTPRSSSRELPNLETPSSQRQVGGGRADPNSGDPSQVRSNVVAVLDQLWDELSPDRHQILEKSFRTIQRLAQELDDQYDNKEYANFIMTASLLYDAVFSYLLSFLPGPDPTPDDLGQPLLKKWSATQAFGLPAKPEVLSFVDQAVHESVAGSAGDLSVGAKTALKIYDDASEVVDVFNDLFRPFHSGETS